MVQADSTLASRSEFKVLKNAQLKKGLGSEVINVAELRGDT